MTQSPAMPMYWGAYIADTTHLTVEEHGVYLLLIASIWKSNGALPDDDNEIAASVKTTLGKWRKIKSRLAPMLVIEGGQIRSTYVDAVVIWCRMDARRPSVPKGIRDLVFLRDKSVCQYCGDTVGPFELDHIFPWSRGGDHSAANLCVACAACNKSKGNRTVEEWREGQE